MNLETDPSNRIPSAAPMPAAAPRENRSVAGRPRFGGMIVFTIVLLGCFSVPLIRLTAYASHAELYTHILMIPFISACLIWMKRQELVMESPANPGLAFLSMALGAVAAGGYWVASRHGWSPPTPDYLAVMTPAFLFFWIGGGFIFLGSKFLGSITFPVAFLFFSVPYPLVVRDGIETFFQVGSADVADVMLRMSGMPVYKTGNHLQLPSFSLAVAPECSGIHSSLILVITSLLAAYLFLKTPWRRFLLVAVVVPLAFLRNGFRIFTIAQLCVNVGPQMIDSWIHRHGGPVFFILSLIPFFLLLKYLCNSEMRKSQVLANPPGK